jgi:hypothetical protein
MLFLIEVGTRRMHLLGVTGLRRHDLLTHGLNRPNGPGSVDSTGFSGPDVCR